MFRSANTFWPSSARPYGATRRPFSSTRVEAVPRPRSDTPEAPAAKPLPKRGGHGTLVVDGQGLQQFGHAGLARFFNVGRVQGLHGRRRFRLRAADVRAGDFHAGNGGSILRQDGQGQQGAGQGQAQCVAVKRERMDGLGVGIMRFSGKVRQSKVVGCTLSLVRAACRD